MKKKILLIEDNEDIRETTTDVLKVAGYDVLTAMNGKEGVEKAMNQQPDLIICDIMLPVMDGYGVLHILSKDDTTSKIPFIFLTARSERSDLRKGMTLGADDYITKPFKVFDLLGAIETRLKKAALLKKEYPNTIESVATFLDNASNIKELNISALEDDKRYYRKKEYVYNQGENPKGTYYLINGVIKTSRTNEQGKEYITGLYKSGDFFGYTALLEEGRHEEAAMAVEDSEVAMIPKDDFVSLVYKNTQISRKFMKILSNSLQDRERQLLKLAYNSVRKRVAEALIKLSEHSDSNEHIINTASREMLASLAGAALESTVRTLSDFRQEGLIEITSNKIILLEFGRLAALKN